jgi:hypothetical protein
MEAEIRLKEAHDSLEEKVKERTAELEEAYNSLKESEKGLAEAQKMAHIGNWDWNIVTMSYIGLMNYIVFLGSILKNSMFLSMKFLHIYIQKTEIM